MPQTDRPFRKLSSPAAHSARNALRLACTGLSAALAVLGVTLATRFWRALPYADDWTAVEFYQRWLQGATTFNDFFAQHNEHRLLVTRVLFLIDFHFFQGRTIFLHTVLVLSHVALGVVLGMLASRERRNGGGRAMAITVATAFLVSPVQLDNLIVLFNAQYLHVCLFALLAFFATAQLTSPMSRLRNSTYMGLAVAATFLVSYTSANGVIATIMTVGLAWILPIGMGARLIISAIAFITVGSFFVGFQLPPGERLYSRFDTFQDMRHFFEFFFAFLGSIGQRPGRHTAMAVGFAGLLAWIALTSSLRPSRRRGGKLDPSMVSLLMLAAFVLATTVGVAIGRAGIEVRHALSGRYSTFSVVFFVSLLLASFRLSDKVSSLPLKRITALAGAALLFLSYLAGLVTVKYAAARDADIDLVTAELRVGRFDPEHVNRIVSAGDVRPVIEFLRAERLSIFAD